MLFRSAHISDVAQLVALQKRCHIDSLTEQDKKDGFLNTVLTAEQLTQIIESEQGIFVAEHEKSIIGLAVCASWQFWRCSPVLTELSHDLQSVAFNNERLSSENSFFWGPVCIDQNSRGRGVFESLYQYALSNVSSKYRYVYTYVHQENTRSFHAHLHKAKLTFTKNIILSGQAFKELVGETRRG